MLSLARILITCSLLAFAFVLNATGQAGPERTSNASISGRITFKGEGVEGVAVGLVRPSSSRSVTPYQTITNADGKYRISNVSPGTFSVVVIAPGFVNTISLENFRSFLVNKGDTVEDVDFVLVRGGVITGKVTDRDGRPVIEHDVRIVATRPDQSHYSPFLTGTRTDDRGVYRAFGIPPGTYFVSAGHDQGELVPNLMGKVGFKQTFYPDAVDTSEAKAISVSEGSETENVDIVLSRSVSNYSLQGKVLDSETGKPLANIGYVLEMFMTANGSSSISNGAVTDKDGVFKWQGLAPGKYAINLEMPPDSEFRGESMPFEVIDQDVTNLIVRTSRGSSVSGVVVFDGLTKPISETSGTAMISAILPSLLGKRNSHRIVALKPDGSFRISGLETGATHFFVARPERFSIVKIERDGVVQPAGLELKDREHVTGVKLFAVSRNGSIRGAIKLAQGELPANTSFKMGLDRLGDSSLFGHYHEGVTVDNRGQFVAEGILPGTYNLHATIYLPGKKPQMSIKQEIVVSGGEMTSVTLTLTAP